MSDSGKSGEREAMIAHGGGARDIKLLLDILGMATAAEVLSRLDAERLSALLEEVDSEVIDAVAGAICTPKHLKQWLELSGGDQTMIEKFVAKAGTDRVLDQIFDVMATRYLPDRVDVDIATVQWRIDCSDGERTYHLAIADGRAQAGRGPGSSHAAITISMSFVNLLRLCAGIIDGMTAFLEGEIGLAGDMLLGAQLTAAFAMGAD